MRDLWGGPFRPGGEASPQPVDAPVVRVDEVQFLYGECLLQLRELALLADAEACVEWIEQDLDLWGGPSDVRHHLEGHRDPRKPFQVALTAWDAPRVASALQPWFEAVFGALLALSRELALRLREGQRASPAGWLPGQPMLDRAACVARWDGCPESTLATEFLVAVTVVRELVVDVGWEFVLEQSTDLESLRRSALAGEVRRDLTGRALPPPRDGGRPVGSGTSREPDA